LLAHEEWLLEHVLFGRANDEIIRRMPCSVMLVKQEPKAAPCWEQEELDGSLSRGSTC